MASRRSLEASAASWVVRILEDEGHRIADPWSPDYDRMREPDRRTHPELAMTIDGERAALDVTLFTTTRGGGPKRSGHVDLLAGLLQCVCGRRLRSDGTFADGRHRKLHPDPCPDWGDRARLGDETWEEPILAQVAGMSLDPATFAQVVAALSSNERPITLDKARFERQIRVLASDNADGKIADDVYLERKRQLRGQIDALERSARPGIPAARTVEWLRALSETWLAADVEEEKAELLHAIYDRIVVSGDRIVSARLTSDAQAHGMALALPQVVMARPTGVERAIPILTPLPPRPTFATRAGPGPPGNAESDELSSLSARANSCSAAGAGAHDTAAPSQQLSAIRALC